MVFVYAVVSILGQDKRQSSPSLELAWSFYPILSLPKSQILTKTNDFLFRGKATYFIQLEKEDITTNLFLERDLNEDKLLI